MGRPICTLCGEPLTDEEIETMIEEPEDFPITQPILCNFCIKLQNEPPEPDYFSGADPGL